MLLLAAALAFAGPQHGIASVYTDSRVACPGYHFSASALTAAHKTLPCGTHVRVTRGAPSVIVTIIDRGPYVRGRIIDLTPAAARALRISGLAEVTVERVE
jgi:rare lipoprotein A